MNQLVRVDLDTKRRQALAKVYGLLIHLADRSENQSTLPEPLSKEIQKLDDPTLEQTEIISKDECPHTKTEFSTPKTEQSNNSVPLKSNIPS